jgi:quercetin dioxygenase-like cupin family protein
MEMHRIEDFFRGWFIGDFEPSVYKTDAFEVGLLTHKKDEVWPKHYQKIATEFNVLVTGLMTLNEKQIVPGDVFIIKPKEVADVRFLADCTILVVKTPSVPGDKYLVES